MDKMLDHYKVIAEKETGFWISFPVRTGHAVSREEWLQLNEHDPEHFQIITFASSGELPQQSLIHNEDEVIERALSVTWSDELLH